MHLTDRTIKNLAPPKRGQRIYYDDVIAGLGIRVTQGGARSFVFNYRRRRDGLERRGTIGRFPEWSTAGAREKAKEWRREIDVGGDPVGEHRTEREAPTFNDLIDRYITEQLPKRRASTQADYTSKLKLHIRPALGKRKVATLTFPEVEALHRQITKTAGPYCANRVVSLLSKLCNLAMQRGLRTDNPCRGLERNDEIKRKRYLSTAEAIRLIAALDEHPDQDASAVFRLLLLTGARKGEVLTMRWADVDLSKGVWSKPAHSTKQKTDHVVPLHAQAQRILAGRLNAAGSNPEVFPGRNGKRRTVHKDWYRIIKAARLDGLRVHDLRHSFASILASAGVGLYTIGELLGHSTPATTARYAHLVDAHLRQAIEHVKLPEAK